MIRRRGHDVETAIDGIEALETLARRDFDIVFLDLQMPVIDGLETARRIRERDIDVHSLVAMTATLDEHVKSRCIDAGFDTIAQKPLSDEILASVLAERAPSTPVADDDVDDGELPDHDVSPAMFERFRSEIASHTTREFEQLVMSIIDGMRSQMTALAAALARGDVDTVARSAHAIRGAAATLGAVRIAWRAAVVERSATVWAAEEQVREARELAIAIEQGAAALRQRIG